MKGQIFKKIAMVAAKSGKTIAAVAKGNSPAIFAGIAIVGACAIAYTTYKCTPKYKDAIKEKEDDRSKASKESITKKEKAKIFIKTMWPMMVAIIVTVTGIVASHKISAKRIAALSAAYSVATQKASEAAERKAEEFIKEKLGEEAANEYKKEVKEEKEKNEKILSSAVTPFDILDTEGGNMLFMDYMSGVAFRGSMGYIEAKLDYINEHSQLSAFGNDFLSYSEVMGEIVPGFPDTGFTMTNGFSVNACDIDRGWPIKAHFVLGSLPNGEPCYVMHFDNDIVSYGC